MRSMKLAASCASVALFLSALVFAKSAHEDKGSFDLTQPARIGSTVLQPGHYEAEWAGPNSRVQVSILRHGKTVATTHAQVKELPKAAPYNAVTVLNVNNHTRRVEEIDFSNRKDALVLANALS